MKECSACQLQTEPPAHTGSLSENGRAAVAGRARRSAQEPSSAFVAFELTAAGYGQDIIDLGAVRYEHGAEVATFSTLVNPGKALPPEALEGTGIEASLLARAPALSEVIPAFDGFLKGAVLLAHGDSYNIWLLREAYEKANNALISPSVDALPTARWVFEILRRRYPYPDYLIGDFIAPPAEPYRAVDCARFMGGEFLRAFDELDEEPEVLRRRLP